MLSIDSTSGKEREFSEWLEARIEAPRKEVFELEDGSRNLLFCWGTPKIVFCSHLDTVPPYIRPKLEIVSPDNIELEGVVKGRGACDAKGQIFSMYKACKALEERGASDFGLLLVSGEETGSWGAKAFAKSGFKAEYLVTGEPTDNCLVSASKGTKSFDLEFIGEAFHSGYPEFGRSAVEMFVDFINELREADFGTDPLLGGASWNVGLLSSDNPQNILSPRLTCRIYFRTSFASDGAVCEWMASKASKEIRISPRGGDTPSSYFIPEGVDIPTKTVSFGSDAPHLVNFEKRMICGPGSITVAHRDDEFVGIRELEKAIDNYLRIYESCN